MTAAIPLKVKIDDLWPELQEGMRSVLTTLSLPRLQWMRLYSLVYNYCTGSARDAGTPAGSRGGSGSGDDKSGATFVGEELYARVATLLKRHMKELLRGAESRAGPALLAYYTAEWDRFTLAMKHLNHIFNYLNRYWVKRELEDGRKDVYEVYTLSLVVWRDHFFSAIKTRLTGAVLSVVEAERDGAATDGATVAAVVHSYVSLGLGNTPNAAAGGGGGGASDLRIYSEFFSREYLEASDTYYAREAAAHIVSDTASEYMRRVKRRLGEERQRAESYLHPSTAPDLEERLRRVLVEHYIDTIAADFQHELEEDRREDMALMYELLLPVNGGAGLDPLRATLEKHVQAVGTATIDGVADVAASDPKVYVETLLRVWRLFNGLVTEQFRSDPEFIKVLDKACRKFVNDNAICRAAGSSAKSPELIAKYVDSILKRGPTKIPPEAAEARLSDLMQIFRFIEDKDVFQSFYSKMLAKRLIHATSISDELEESMISKLRTACGFEYTAKLNRMYTDMSVSRELTSKFKSSGWKPGKLTDFNVLVLATGSWPLQPPATNFTLPPELKSVQDAFATFYAGQHHGRRLNWLHQLSKGDMTATCFTKFGSGGGPASYVLQASTYQLGILMLFNARESISLEDIQAATQMTDAALETTMVSLVKTRMLDAVDEPGEFKKSTLFSVNRTFSSKRQRVAINVPVGTPQQQQQAQREEATQAQQAIEESRMFQIQAALVRIMKTRKKISHTALVTEVIAQLQTRFKPTIPAIKKCIDLLIEKEYLERIEGQKDMYSYVA